jgi:hypothetical protein
MCPQTFPSFPPSKTSLQQHLKMFFSNIFLFANIENKKNYSVTKLFANKTGPFLRIFPWGGIFWKGTFLWDNILEGVSNGWRPRVWPIYHAWMGGVFEIWITEMSFPAFWASKFAPKFMLTILVFEINKGKNAQKV